ncbi:unnamed protein product [Phaeothamnion confervicola]
MGVPTSLDESSTGSTTSTATASSCASTTPNCLGGGGAGGGLDDGVHGGIDGDFDDEDCSQPVDEPHSHLMLMMCCAGCISGVVAFLYNWAMRGLLKLMWERVPAALMATAAAADAAASAADSADAADSGGSGQWQRLLADYGWCYTVAVTMVFGCAAGLAIKWLGFPGDLPNVIHCVHGTGVVPMRQTLPMVASSLCSIIAGGSLGPEAPLVAISASCCGWVSMQLFRHAPLTARKFTLMGASAGLSAFFGVPLGGALFALEACHTMGAQYYQVSVYCVGAGVLCLAIFRTLCGNDPFGAIWHFPAVPPAVAAHVIQGALLGAVAAAAGLLFAALHRGLGARIKRAGLGDFERGERPLLLAGLGAAAVAALGVLVPPSMFWSEMEMEALAVLGSPLPHIWPLGGVWRPAPEPLEWDSGPMFLLVGLVKLLAISVTVHAGFRGGFIFPLFFAGASLGRAVTRLPVVGASFSPTLACMSLAAGLNVSVTRTPFASTLILTGLCGVPDVAAPVLAAALTALFLTHGRQFIHSQRDRGDVVLVDDLKSSLSGIGIGRGSGEKGNSPFKSPGAPRAVLRPAARRRSGSAGGGSCSGDEGVPARGGKGAATMSTDREELLSLHQGVGAGGVAASAAGAARYGSINTQPLPAEAFLPV